MINQKYVSHTSHLLHIKANILTVVIYAVGLIGMAAVSYLHLEPEDYFWFVFLPIMVLVFEKDSIFIRFHAFLAIILLWIGPFAVSLIYDLLYLAHLYAFGMIFALIIIPSLFIIGLYCLIKSYGYYLTDLPFFGKIALYLAKL